MTTAPTNPSRTASWSIWVIIVAVIVFVGVGVGFAINKNNVVEQGEQTVGTPVKVVETSRSHNYYIQYQYTVEGSSYEVRGEHKWKVASEAQRQLEATETVTVYYDLNNPSNAVVKD